MLDDYLLRVVRWQVVFVIADPVHNYWLMLLESNLAD